MTHYDFASVCVSPCYFSWRVKLVVSLKVDLIFSEKYTGGEVQTRQQTHTPYTSSYAFSIAVCNYLAHEEEMENEAT